LTAAEIAERLGGARRNGDGYLCRCPSHDDRRASLSIKDGERRLLAYCFAGCGWPSISSALRERGLL